MNAYDLRMHDNVDLHKLLDRLSRNELDLQERLAKRIDELGSLDAISDPQYQRHFFAVEALKAQRIGVESELHRRESSVRGNPRSGFRLLAGWLTQRFASAGSSGGPGAILT
jgi:hypothetical protein